MRSPLFANSFLARGCMQCNPFTMSVSVECLKMYSHIHGSQPSLPLPAISHVDYHLSTSLYLRFYFTISLLTSRPSPKSYRRPDKCHQCSSGRKCPRKVRSCPYPNSPTHFFITNQFQLGTRYSFASHPRTQRNRLFRLFLKLITSPFHHPLRPYHTLSTFLRDRQIRRLKSHRCQ